MNLYQTVTVLHCHSLRLPTENLLPGLLETAVSVWYLQKQNKSDYWWLGQKFKIKTHAVSCKIVSQVSNGTFFYPTPGEVVMAVIVVVETMSTHCLLVNLYFS